jgi:nucleoside-diphosphate-sugar epimerase
MQKTDLVVVAGGGGFIGGHLVSALQRAGWEKIRSVDIKPTDQWWQVLPGVENLQLDLSKLDHCQRALKGARYVYNLAADMGGMGFIEHNKALCMLSVLINTHLLQTAKAVNGRNSDNTLIQEKFGWEPSIKLADGLEKTYRWIYDQLKAGALMRTA